MIWMARFAITSLVFMLLEVPDPVWKMSTTNSRSYFPAATSCAAWVMASATLPSSLPLLRFTSAAAFLISASARITRRGSRSPLTGKFSAARCVCAPYSASTGTSTLPRESVSTRHSLLAITLSLFLLLLFEQNFGRQILGARLQARARQLGCRVAQAIRQHLRERPQQLGRKLRLLADDLVEVLARQDEDARPFFRGGADGTRVAPVDQRHLADVRA